MLLHAGMVTHHRTAMGVDAGISALDGQEVEATLAKALLSSVCRPAHPSDPNDPRTPSPPSKAPVACLACCCPGSKSLLVPVAMRDAGLGVALVPKQLERLLRQAPTRERVAERPPVRGPPDLA